MQDELSKKLRIILYVLLGISVVFILLYFAGGVANESTGEMKFTQAFLILTYILVIATGIIAIGLPLIRSFADPQNLKKSGMQFAVLLAVVGISYLFASKTPMKMLSGDVIEDAAVLKLSGTMIISIYILIAVAVIAILYSGVSKLVKK